VNREIDPFENKAFFTCYVGAAGSGKSSLMISSLLHKKIYRKAFHNCFLICPPSSRNSIKDDPFGRLKRGHVFDDLSYDALQEIYDELTNQSDDSESGEYQKNLLIIDDQTQALKSLSIAKLFNHMILNRRHLHLSIILCVQYFNSIPTQLRKNLSSVVLCNRPVNTKEMENIREEVLGLDRHDAAALIKHVFKQKYDKLFIICEPLTYYRNMNRLTLLPVEEEDNKNDDT
jgi:hypothetical protein